MSERILSALVVVVAILATIPAVAEAVPYAGLALVILGLVAGVMDASADVNQRIAVYVLAVALPVFSDSLDVIPVVGAWVNSVLDGVATALQGMAVAYVLISGWGHDRTPFA